MHWTDADHSFCESRILGMPEYLNSASSLIIVGFGIYGLLNIYNDCFADIIYTLLTIVGIGSTGYHWTGNIGWGLLDETPMILLIFGIIGYATKLVRDKECANARIYEHKFATFMNLLCMTLFIICNTMSICRKWFPYVFACVGAYLYYMLTRLFVLSPKYAKNGYNTIYIILASVAMWSATEITCNYIQLNMLLIGHPLWHLFIGYGCYNITRILQEIGYNPIDIIDCEYTPDFQRIWARVLAYDA